MLKITRSQLSAFSAAEKDGFVARMMKHFAKHFPIESVSDDFRDTEAVVRQGIASAKIYGVVGERDVCLYIGLFFILGYNFMERQETEWVHRILAQDTLSPSLRLDRIYNCLMDYSKGMSNQYDHNRSHC